ncbi:hypothetical protein [Catellatospora methionotrophica]|uniref:hypothetical protein n=1 Tax=Catellatospora methionotrophica TaxID=121620 RepID=UPI0033CED0D9
MSNAFSRRIRSAAVVAACVAAVALVPAPAHASPLVLDVSCWPEGGLHYGCQVDTLSGGTAPYSITWLGGHAGQYSFIDTCNYGYRTQRATVTDATGAKVTDSVTYFCTDLG